MIAPQPPEVGDGGFWSVVEAVTDPETGISPGAIPGVGWCAWYAEIGGVLYAAVRTPQPVAGIVTVDVRVADVLAGAGYAGKPRGRIRGK